MSPFIINVVVCNMRIDDVVLLSNAFLILSIELRVSMINCATGAPYFTWRANIALLF